MTVSSVRVLNRPKAYILVYKKHGENPCISTFTICATVPKLGWWPWPWCGLRKGPLICTTATESVRVLQLFTS